MNRHEKRKAKLKAEGLCTCCGQEKAHEGILNCIKCRDRINAKNKTRLDYKKDNLICVIGVNASLDHIIPKSAGGSSDEDNLQWIHGAINSAKLALSVKDFLELCADIAFHKQLCKELINNTESEDLNVRR